MASEAALPKFTHYIDGERVEPVSGRYLPTDDPFSGQTWAHVARGDAEDVKRAVESAHRAFESGAWPEMTATQRGHALWKLGDIGRRQCWTACRNRAAGQRQAVDRGHCPSEVHGRLFQVLRRPGRQDPECSHPNRQEGSLRLYQVRAQGRRCHHHAVELAADFHQLETGASSGRRCTAVVKPSEFTSASMVELAALFPRPAFRKASSM